MNKTIKHPQTYIDRWKSVPESEYTLIQMIKDAQEDAYQLALDEAICIVKEATKSKKT